MPATYTKTVKQDSRRGRVVVYERTGPPTRYSAGTSRGDQLTRLVAAVRALTAEVRRAKAEGRL